MGQAPELRPEAAPVLKLPLAMSDPQAPFLAAASVHHRWHRRLFVAPLAAADRAEIFEQARVEGREFLERWDPAVFLERRPALDAWYRSREGQDVLCRATRRLWRHLMALAPHGMPAHDARHAMVLVPAAAVLLAHDEEIVDSALESVRETPPMATMSC